MCNVFASSHKTNAHISIWFVDLAFYFTLKVVYMLFNLCIFTKRHRCFVTKKTTSLFQCEWLGFWLCLLFNIWIVFLFSSFHFTFRFWTNVTVNKQKWCCLKRINAQTGPLVLLQSQLKSAFRWKPLKIAGIFTLNAISLILRHCKHPRQCSKHIYQPSADCSEWRQE